MTYIGEETGPKDSDRIFVRRLLPWSIWKKYWNYFSKEQYRYQVQTNYSFHGLASLKLLYLREGETYLNLFIKISYICSVSLFWPSAWSPSRTVGNLPLTRQLALVRTQFSSIKAPLQKWSPALSTNVAR